MPAPGDCDHDSIFATAITTASRDCDRRSPTRQSAQSVVGITVSCRMALSRGDRRDNRERGTDAACDVTHDVETDVFQQPPAEQYREPGHEDEADPRSEEHRVRIAPLRHQPGGE